ncbi:MAG: adenylate/guanylate cyclase domain-containing protein [Anaerolineales bacterium]
MKSNSSLETRIIGSFSTRFWLELFGNTAHFPIANLLLELLVEKPLDYLRVPDPYILVMGSLVQAYWLTRWQTNPHPRRFWGNLIGPALYTLFESLFEGPRFFSVPNHLAYWGFSLVIGALQSLRSRLPAVFNNSLIITESITRTAILFLMYAIFEIHANPTQTSSLDVFFSDTSHQFIGLAVLFLGFIIGLASLTAERYLGLLKETSAQLQTYSEWLLGRDLLAQTLANPSALSLTRRERIVMFMDIRGFTHWSEKQPPEKVVSLLTQFYQVTEPILTRHGAIKFKLSADEVMAVFSTADSAIRAALELHSQVNQLLSIEHLGVGIGLDSGLLVEGLLGSVGVKFYDVLGDTVNTAKRIENAAQAGEVLISENVYKMIGQAVATGTKRVISVKGKETPLVVYPLEDKGAG